jgi:phosphatidate phosphatase APP1
VTASIGYGGPDVVRLFARVLLAPPATSDGSPSGRRPTRRGWRSLLTLPAAGVEVTVTVGGRTHLLTSDRGGYVHADVAANLSPGWHDTIVAVSGRAPVVSRVRVVDPLESHGVISDIDDTILVTWVPRPLLAAWNTFFLREHARRPVPGMSELLGRLAGEQGLMVYVSTGAWNFAPHLERFMAEHGFPPGPMLLTDWGPTEQGWFRSGTAHKRATLERLRREHPNTKWVLVGDDGQRDPEVYSEFATMHPEAVTAVGIRRLTRTQQVLAASAAPASPPESTGDPSLVPVPWVTGADGHDLASALADAGVIHVGRVQAR